MHGQPGVILASRCWMCVNASGGNSASETFHHSVHGRDVQYYQQEQGKGAALTFPQFISIAIFGTLIGITFKSLFDYECLA